MSISKIKLFCLAISFISLYLGYFSISALAQVETTFDNTASSEDVTSVNDAILKSLLIISQVAVFGIIFNYFFFSRFLREKRDGSNNILYESKQQAANFHASIVRRVASIVILCSLTLILFSTCIILLQSYQLSENLEIDISSAFDILFTASVGQVWMLRIGTSSAIIVMMIIYYYVSRITAKTNQDSIDSLVKSTENKKTYFVNNRLNQIFLLILMILSSINLYSNSMVSHSNSLSSFSTFAVSMDWIHFMAVSIWIGGLFFLSLILSKTIKPVEYESDSISSYKVSNVPNNIISIHNISISLMNFSFIVIFALCVIGISGLYLSYVHLQDLNSLFSTSYGQILILKLGLAFPLIFIGRYNQLKIFKFTSQVSNLVKYIDNKNNPADSYFQQHRENRFTLYKALGRSLKIESILGIAVLIVASFLSVNSPPSLEARSGESINIQTSNTNDYDNLFFFYLVISLVIIISVIGIVNYKKNQKQIKIIFTITGNDR